jgi:hypothetical protein
LINAFIILNLAGMIFWSFAWECAPKSLVKFVSGPYMRFTGLWQGWNMFAPNPYAAVFSIKANVTFRDGTSADWSFPEMQGLGFCERYQKERFHKFAQDSFRPGQYLGLWKPTAAYIARQLNNPANPPVRVELIRRECPIAPPVVNEDLARLLQPRQETFYSHAIKPEDLR